MNINFLKKTGIIFAGTLGAIYALFLIAPFIISPIANSYLPMVNDEIKKATGLNSKIEDFRILWKWWRSKKHISINRNPKTKNKFSPSMLGIFDSAKFRIYVMFFKW